ncbi:Lipoprotein-releasing system ATP-binding protein LolD [Pseudolycoriella hygida]|uniref:Lipoprotein-releasing system ATP-binding protein LolD n=1 Tax=Pseudolycoriella hygida TaxID=35572 RepID=A0A9Q0N8C6_9DIPT|nr:Lipoprotein-releasing system ATP-binding protein LolD [Pseudolycoriella hygida]
MSVMNGFHSELTKNIIGLNGDITINPFERSINNYPEIKTKLLNAPYIKHITPCIIGQALALGPRTSSGAIIRGVDLKDLEHKNEILNNINTGSFENFFGKDVAAVGTELAYNLGVQVGMKIKLISTNSISTVFGSMPRSKEFTIIATFTSGMYDYDSATILMPLLAAQNFLSFENDINLIEVETVAPESAETYSSEIQRVLGTEFKVSSWQRSHLQFLNALAVERVAMFTILSLIIMVAAFNIVSSLFMIVKDKISDIAILRSMGATTRQIMLIFICNGTSIIEVLSNINLTLSQGEMIAIIGTSGSGKSTLLHVAGLLDTPDSGKVEITPNENLKNNIDLIRLQHIGFVYQQHHLLQDFTAIENVAMPKLIAGGNYKLALQEAEELLGELGLAKKKHNMPGELSGGQQQRVAIARALINNPSIILADEPTGNLDPTTAKEVFDLFLKMVNQKNIAMIIVTHNLDIAHKIHRIYELKHGALDLRPSHGITNSKIIKE